MNTFRAGRMDELAGHPTVKPVAMVAEALKDCTRRGDIVLDTFAGAGTTILAAERVGRRAYSLELLEPKYVDVAIRRWQAFTRRDAVHADTGQTFEEVAGGRKDAQPAPSATQIGARTAEGRIDDTQALRVVPAKDAPYEVGYGKPPKHTQLQARPVWTSAVDRPRGQRNFRTAVRDALQREESPSGRASGRAPSPEDGRDHPRDLQQRSQGAMPRGLAAFHPVGPMGGPDGRGAGAFLSGIQRCRGRGPSRRDSSSAMG